MNPKVCRPKIHPGYPSTVLSRPLLIVSIFAKRPRRYKRMEEKIQRLEKQKADRFRIGPE